MYCVTLKRFNFSLNSLFTISNFRPLTFSVIKNHLRKINTTMKAIRIHSFGGPSVLQVDNDVPLPVPKENQVLVKVEAAGINPVDVQLRECVFKYKPKLPFILGKEIAGNVVQVRSLASHNNNNDQYKPGDRVVCCLPYDGGYAQYVACDTTNILPLPGHVTYAQGAAVYVAYFTAIRALVTILRVQKEDLVLIHGASGAVGMAAVQVAKSVGAKVVGTAGTKEGKQMVHDNGADFVVDHREKGHLSEAIAMVENCKGFDAILENQASANLSMDLSSLAPCGRIAVVGSRENVRIDPRMLIKTEGCITGVNLSQISKTEWCEYKARIVRGMRDGWLSPVIAREYVMEEIQLAHEHLMKKHGHQGKLVLKVL